MKKIFYLLFIFASLLILVDSCKIDNFPSPGAQFFGGIKDSTNAALVETDLTNGSTIGAYEQGYPTPVLQPWLIEQSGEFRNNLVFANTYNFTFASCNFFPDTVNNIVIKNGPNEHDFKVVPYIRIKNCSITNDAVNNKIVATFNLEGGKPTVKVASVTLYAWTDMYVGANAKYTIATGTGVPSKTLSGAAQTIVPATLYTLSIDLAANPTLFKTGRNYYFRVGAIGIQSGVGTIRSNYVPYVKITL